MNENANPQAFPALATMRDQYIGLTKRELFALVLEAALLGDSQVSDRPRHVAEWALIHADALLAELAKPQEAEPEDDAD